MKYRTLLTSLLLIFLSVSLLAQEPSDTTVTKKKAEKIKKGWNIGGVPAIAFDSDLGFKYGVVINLFNYGDGSHYPKYDHSLYFEWSRTTKGSGINQFVYDSEHLIPGVRVSADASLFTEQALDFYGFNGYNAYYNHAYENDNDTINYISRMFYRYERKLTHLRVDFQGKLSGEHLHWLAGIEFNHVKINTVDIAKLNKGKDDADKLPPVDLLYDKYAQWGVIGKDSSGGNTTLLKLGMVYDTRDMEANPMHGIWTDVQLLIAPSFLGNGYDAYSRIAITHRQYFTLVPKVLSFAYRLSYQAKLGGHMPFYMLPFVYNTAPSMTRDGLGGAKTIRGVLRNRVVGEDFIYGNLEIRWKFLRTVWFNQNIYLALSGFLDGGMVTGKYKVDESKVPTDYKDWLDYGKEKLHMGAGGGFHFVMNENFIIAVDYGRALDPKDGKSGLYIGLNYLY